MPYQALGGGCWANLTQRVDDRARDGKIAEMDVQIVPGVYNVSKYKTGTTRPEQTNFCGPSKAEVTATTYQPSASNDSTLKLLTETVNLNKVKMKTLAESIWYCGQYPANAT